MRLLIIFGSILLLGVYADSAEPVLKDITVDYAKLTTDSDPFLHLCGVSEITEIGDQSVELTIEDEGDVVEVKNLPGVFSDPCYDFNLKDNGNLINNQHQIILKITVTPTDPPEQEITVYEFNGKFTFKETDTSTIEKTYFESIKVLQFKKGKVSQIKIETEPANVADYESVQCDGTGENIICVQPIKEDKIQTVTYIDTFDGDTIPYLYETKDIGKLSTVQTCDAIFNIIAVYDNDDDVVNKGFKITADPVGDIANFYAVSNNVLFDLATKKIPDTEDFKVIKHTENKCEKISATVRPMTFLDPFSNTVEVSWTKDTDQYYLEVSEKVSKNLHIDCSGISDLGTCIAYVFDDKNMPTDEALTYQLSAASGAPDIKAYSPGKSKTKQTYKHKEPNSGGQKSLKALNLNQFEINWNTKQGKLCVEDALYEKNKKSQFRYELVIGFDDGNWKKHIANYNDESTICFNDFEITQLIENKLGVHFLVMKRGSDTNQIVASDMITTDLIVPEISEVNDETISLEFENLNSPFLIRDEKTKNIISKNEKKIHNLAFLKSSHENKSLFNRNLVLETRKEHTQMKVHFKIPQKVNAA